MVSTTQRTSREEAMDDFALEGEELRDALDKIAGINQWLGGNKITLDGIEELVKSCPKNRVISIVDIGCGNGDMCRAVADFARQEGLNCTILGIDANAYTISHAQASSAAYPTVSYAVMNVFSDDFAALEYDIALCTLTLHHFADNEIINLMDLLVRRAKLGVVVNDLERSALAYRLFEIICLLFGLSKFSKDDGLVSILRGFKKHDLEVYAKQLGLTAFSIRWRWAFRYQWIIRNLCV